MKKLVLKKNQKAIMLDNAITKTTLAPAEVILPKNNIIKNPTPTYLHRKSMEPKFQDLFAALLKIPDKEIQQRVLDAINGPCRHCKNRKEHIYVSAGTQTDANNSTADILGTTAESVYAATLEKRHEDTATSTEHATTEQPEPKRRKRKRKICLPRVVKQSHAAVQMRQHQQHPHTTQSSKHKIKKLEPNDACLPAPVMIDEHPDPNLALPEVYNYLLDETNIDKDHIIKTMEMEFLRSEIWHDGYLPIHQAIMINNEMVLQRQIYVWDKKKVDLNELITDDDNDCLQLAVLYDCLPIIFKILLEKQLRTDTKDEHSNNIIHMAIVNGIQFGSFEILLDSIALELLLQTNDDGYTPLHVAVRKDSFQHAELILNVLDKRLANKLVYPRKQYDECTRQEFRNYYENACNELETDTASSRNPLKVNILNASDMRSGNTALFYCVENKLDHIAYLLLAHLADPCKPNYSSQSAKLYFQEFGKSFDLSLKVDKAMDKVVALLKQ